ncbi:hypothetical protein EBQ74_11655 [bacterium]|nr:hypothetical protein [bacterium]
MKLPLLKKRGSILIESCILFFISLFTIVIQIEVVRRSWASAVLQILAFEDVREQVMGQGMKFNRIQEETFLRLIRSWGVNHSLPIKVLREEYLRPTSGEAVSRVHIKYPSIIRLRETPGVKKINFEVTEVCRFPFSFQH